MSFFWLFVAMVALGGAGYLGYRLLILRRAHAKTEEDLNKIKGLARKLKAEADRLAQYKGIADADSKAMEIRRAADAELQAAKQEASNVVAQAKQEADATVVGAAAELQAAKQEASNVVAQAKQKADAAVVAAKEQAKTLHEDAQGRLHSATLQASKIVDQANKRAEEIGGKAYDALKNADLYEKTVEAMRNIIGGYGDRYIIPMRSLLDDLAEDFGHTEAGRNLTNARERSRLMIQNGTAATCDYVEASRRDTAVSFVIDAFNGKVDSILSRVRSDNAGTLEQQIRDAFTLVNYNGKAFRQARITEEYLAARLDESKWAAVAQQLKLEEREEQRRIKEQMREEVKAQREYERAMREAANEEEMLRKAMAKAQQQVAQASAEQKARFEQQLAELQQKLKEAEERSQRALSMAQQTKKGHVYIISNVGAFGEDVLKIGLTRRLEPLDRIRELGDSSVPFPFDVHAVIMSEDAPALESQLHRHFMLMQVNKVNPRKEFFRASLKDIRQQVEKLRVEAKWTMTAEAREYRETLAIEKAIEGDPAAREAWVTGELDFDTVGAAVVEDEDEEQ